MLRIFNDSVVLKISILIIPFLKRQGCKLRLVQNRVERYKTTYVVGKVRLSGSGCGSVGRAVASNTRDPRFESRHLTTF